ncbi:MAG: hypothetical protein L3K52_02640 [Candidatus Thiothrix sulfatifontis]|nr:MAG: hypothetical protein L3K52_02640 [Candidatus Thiothrix sulfatifontis]
MQKIAIIDYNMGNLHSVERAVSHAAAGNATVAITSATANPPSVGYVTPWKPCWSYSARA